MPDLKISILIVDDQEPVRTSLAQVFTELGHRVQTAANGLQALTEILQGVPDILLSDLNMANMSGFELLSVVRCRFPAIRMIAMSGAFSGSQIPSGVTADAFYEKGSDMAALLKALDTALLSHSHVAN